MLKQFNSFFGYDLQKGSQIIAIISAIFSSILTPFYFYIAFSNNSLKLDEEHYINFRKYGTLHALISSCTIIGVKNLFHIIICAFMYRDAKIGFPVCLRVWLRSTVIGTCVLGVLGSYSTVLLFAAGPSAYAQGVIAVLLLLIVIPSKIYFALVVNSYHNHLVPGHIWGSTMRCSDTYQGPRSCQLVPQIQVNQPTSVVVTVER